MEDKTNGNTEPRSVLVDGKLGMLRAILDIIIPSDTGFPGAGELGASRYVERNVAESPHFTCLLIDGLDQIEIESYTTYKKDFTDLKVNHKIEVLRVVEQHATGFFEVLVRYCYNFYYTHPKVLKLLGLETRHPQPKGYQLETIDLTLLDKVTARGQFYRQI